MQILVVEPDPAARMLIESVLTRDLDANVHTVGRAEGANARLDGERFDAVVLDHDLPDADGLAVLQHVQVTQPTTAVLYLVEPEDGRAARRALAEGAADHRVKDLDVYRSLPETVQEAVQRPPRQGSPLHGSGARDDGNAPADGGLGETTNGAAARRLEGLLVCSPTGETLYSSLDRAQPHELLSEDATRWVQAAQGTADDVEMNLGTLFGTLQGEEQTIALLSAPETVILVGVYDGEIEPTDALSNLRKLLDRLRGDGPISSRVQPITPEVRRALR